ncbi:MAG: site-specific DNA-methyltransferase [Verrucomicrobiales bacterium]|nr:site-specific DNA-methyltransferase [Verrucomicrobiales bacterium]
MPPSRYDDLSHEELVRLLEARDRRDATRYGLVWEANEIERDRAINDDFVALDLDPDLSTPPGEGPAGGWRNLIIEGDNFDALRYLRMTHAGRVRCIYIDPPYNTGNRDFVYNDRYVDATDAWRHSTWCEFMYQRLSLAKDLLTQDGVIFVSIDDNEVFSLGLLMQKVFGEGNFVGNIIWQKIFSPKNTAKHFSADHDFIIAFALDGDAWRPNLLPRSEASIERYKNPDNDPRGPWTSGDVQARNPYSLGIYPITCPSGRVIPGPSKGSYWRVSAEKLKELDADGRIWWGKDGNGVPRIKRFLSEVIEGRVPQTIWYHTEVGSTQDAKKELLAAMDYGDSAPVFSTPKPLALMDRILRIATGPDDLVLDFFAGSGTTAHAVLKLNAEDGGRRRFILVSNAEATEAEPDKNLCRDVCARRVGRAIAGYGAHPPLPGDYAYLRCTKIRRGRLLSLAHEQVWTALQLMHGESLHPYQPGAAVQMRPPAADGDAALYYVPKVTTRALEALAEAAAGHPAGGICYSWQPDLVRVRLRSGQLEHAGIPEALARKFRLGR